jgi:hypothetical protein
MIVMRVIPTLSLSLFVSSISAATLAAPIAWTREGPAVRAQITGGPWVLSEGDAAAPMGGFPAPNPGTSAFEPYYHSYTTGTDQSIQGYFDYRPYGYEEAVVAASSSDYGKTWTFQSKVADFSPSLANDAAAPSDVGEGHPFVATFGGKTFLYTLDRSAGFVDSAGMIVRQLSPTVADPLGGVPAQAQLGASAPARTVGLANPDGIFAVIPGMPNTVLYLEKQLGGAPVDAGADGGDAGPPGDLTRLHLADTTDGITFTNDRLVQGIIESNQGITVGPRGTLVHYADGHYGMFYSAGVAGEDSDAFHYIGYAESTDLTNWTVVNGLAHPLLSTDKTADPQQADWYAGRVYAPNVTFSADGCKGTLIFSGYKMASPKKTLNDYRQVGVATLTRPCAPPDAGEVADGGDAAVDAGVSDEDAGGAIHDAGAPTTDASGSKPDGGANQGGDGGGDDGGCSFAPAAATGTAAWLSIGTLGVLVLRRRRRTRA